MTYKASNGNHSLYKNFNDLASAESYYTSVGLGIEYIITGVTTVFTQTMTYNTSNLITSIITT